jgi:hypothetical protein
MKISFVLCSILLLPGCAVPAGLVDEPKTNAQGVQDMAEAQDTATRSLAGQLDQARMDTYQLLLVHMTLIKAYQVQAIDAAKCRAMAEFDAAAFSLIDRGFDLQLFRDSSYAKLLNDQTTAEDALRQALERGGQYPNDPNRNQVAGAQARLDTINRLLGDKADILRAELVHQVILRRDVFQDRVNTTLAKDYEDHPDIPPLPPVPAGDASAKADSYLAQLHTFASQLVQANDELSAALEYERNPLKQGEHFLAGTAKGLGGAFNASTAGSLAKDFLSKPVTDFLATIQKDENALTAQASQTVNTITTTPSNP